MAGWFRSSSPGQTSALGAAPDTKSLSCYNASVEAFREREYPMLKDNTYLDHAGTTLYSRSLVDKFASDMTATLLGNPHAGSASSQAASELIEDVRLRTLQFFGADPAEFDLVFVANATAGAKLVADTFRAQHGGFSYAYHQACHTSLVGVREEARLTACVSSEEVEEWAQGTRAPAFSSFSSEDGSPNATKSVSAENNITLFAYPAQSNMDGQRFPLAWAQQLRSRHCSMEGSSSLTPWTLLDAAAYCSTAPLDLSDADAAPDFVLVSFYKMFGFPDLAALLVRRPAEPLFDARRYFGGGTVDVVVCAPREQWHAPKRAGAAALHDRLEDGTLPVHSILALRAALATHAALFGSMHRVAAHVSCLAARLHAGLASLRHGNGTPVCVLYSPNHTSSSSSSSLSAGPVVALNVRNARGAWVGLAEFDKLATLKRFHIRTGGVCNPGGIAAALDLAPWEMRRNFSHGLHCGGADMDDIVAGKPTGVIRVSLGAMSTVADVDRFVAFVNEFYREAVAETTQELATQTHQSHKVALPSPAADSLFVASISVYPIKSCGAFAVPAGTPWEIRPEGLAWDREWCLVHRGTRRALSQKQYPQMVRLWPVLDFEQGVLRVSCRGWPGREVCVPLSHNPALFRAASTAVPPRSRASRVCGEEVAAQVYTAEAIHTFFSDALGVPCLLARFPPGGQGPSMRHAKAHLQSYQTQAAAAAAEQQRQKTVTPKSSRDNVVVGAAPDAALSPLSLSATLHAPLLPASPPDSDSEKPLGLGGQGSANPAATTDAVRRRILLSNESPILAIHMASLRALNAALQDGAEPVPPAVFRANLVLDTRNDDPSVPPEPYAEDTWARMRIGAARQSFQMLGACRRCHMVCVDQDTGVKRDEPFVTLAKTRRFDGKVFFGTHMGHDPDGGGGGNESSAATPERQYPTITVGDVVEVE